MTHIVYSNKKVKDKWDEIWRETTNIEGEIHSIEFEPEITKIMHRFIRNDHKILEAGCGLGRFMLYWDQKGYDIYGVDYSSYGLQTLKQYYPHLKIYLSDVENLSFPNEYFNICLSLGVLEHIEEGPLKGLQEAYRVLKKDGILIITGPCYEINLLARYMKFKHRIKSFCKAILKRPVEPEKKDDLCFLEYHYTIDEISDYIKKAGFYIIEKGYFGINRTLWTYFPKLRHQTTKGVNGYYTLIRTPYITVSEVLNIRGKILSRLISLLFSSAFALGWIIVAQKK
ncbi:MAG: methyltransferase domain-containing protein [Planctomycetota bacterium]|nr:methyltransferase domain-containing protein [Planctomycetota bacterium]